MPEVASFPVEQAMTATQRMINAAWQAMQCIRQSSALNFYLMQMDPTSAVRPAHGIQIKTVTFRHFRSNLNQGSGIVLLTYHCKCSHKHI